ncbi:MAG: hypothetical protein MUE33_04220 [Cytophagaceae bacterium]|jgi:hypothetical protein|nr:hypothetical protein [Cytophagaceae bacterium]
MSDSTQSIEQELMDYTSDSLSSASSIIVDTLNGSVTVNYESLAADPQAQSMFNLFAGFGIGLFIFL